ncbi:MAG: hypothetical protein JNL34_16905 [Anaerolineae bacterium]|nr:hypothetical protein [Anaerolineae bacterium]
MLEYTMDYQNVKADQFHREAANYRLVRLAAAGRARRRGLIAAVLGHTGQGLIVLGTSLHQRFAEPAVEMLTIAQLDTAVQS